jgi:hypothetical protein
VPAKAHLPEWFRPLSVVDASKLSVTDTGLTVKRCMPFLDAMTMGWIIPSATTVRMEIREGRAVMEAGWDLDRTMMSNHGMHQVKGNPCGNPCGSQPPRKFHSYRTSVTPPGWNRLFITPMNRRNGIFEIISGIVDTDTHRSPVHFPFLATGPGGLHVTKQGSPIVLLIPVRRDAAEVGSVAQIGGRSDCPQARTDPSRDLRDWEVECGVAVQHGHSPDAASYR